MTYTYCPHCGNKLTQKEIGDEGLVPFCLTCQKPFFSFSHPCVLCIVINENNKIALIKQSYVSQNYVGVAGYIKQGETIEECACREVEEETGLEVISAKYLNNYYYEKRDLLMIGVVCRVKNGDFNISKEVEDAKWFIPEEAVTALTPGSVIQTMVKEFMQL